MPRPSDPASTTSLVAAAGGSAHAGGVSWAVQLSDLHFSRYVHPDIGPDLHQFGARVLSGVRPGALLLTGDLVDGKTQHEGSAQHREEWQVSVVGSVGGCAGHLRKDSGFIPCKVQEQQQLQGCVAGSCVVLADTTPCAGASCGVSVIRHMPAHAWCVLTTEPQNMRLRLSTFAMHAWSTGV